jgi:hypothetical protein
MITVDRELDAQAIVDEQLRQRLRNVVLELVPNKWGIRDRIRELVT